ncbi:MAG TPA: MFS transporter, partial [Gemmatimonadaceae bacterium]
MRGKLTVLLVTAFVDMLGLIIVYPLLALYATRLGATAGTVGILVAAFSVAQLVSAPAWGRMSDRYGRRPAILFGLLVSAVAYVIFAFAGSIWLLLVSRLIQGLGGGTIGVVQAYVADISVEKDRAKALGWLSAVTSLGAVVGPAIGSILVRIGGYSAPGLGSAILCVLVSAFAWRYLRESRTDTAQFEAMHSPAPKSTSAIRDVIARPDLPASRLIWIYTVAIGAFYGTTPLLPLILAERLGATTENVGYFIVYLGGMGVIVRTGILSRVIERWGEARVARTGLVLLAIGLAMVAAIRSYPTMLISLTLMPMGTAFTFPCVTAMLSRVVPGKQRGLYMGVQHTFGGVSRVAFPLIAGYGMDLFGQGIPFVFAGVMVLATLLLTA